MITLTDIAYVRSGVADLEAATRFATGIVGLELASSTEAGVAHLRADHRHHCLALVEGPSGVISSAFTVADSDALAVAETELERAGISVCRGAPAEARSRRVREFIAFDDPFGNRLELVSQGVHIEMGPGRHPQSTAIFLYFLGPEGFTYEYSFGVRRIEDDAAWIPRTFDPDEPGSIDMWLGPVGRPSSQPQLRPPVRQELARSGSAS